MTASIARTIKMIRLRTGSHWTARLSQPCYRLDFQLLYCCYGRWIVIRLPVKSGLVCTSIPYLCSNFHVVLEQTAGCIGGRVRVPRKDYPTVKLNQHSAPYDHKARPSHTDEPTDCPPVHPSVCLSVRPSVSQTDVRTNIMARGGFKVEGLLGH